MGFKKLRNTMRLFAWINMACLFVLLSFQTNCSARSDKPEISIISEGSPGAEVLYGLTKLTDVLEAKKISYEKVASLQEVHGKTVLAVGLSNNDGLFMLHECYGSPLY